jgi:hypothetical protein
LKAYHYIVKPNSQSTSSSSESLREFAGKFGLYAQANKLHQAIASTMRWTPNNLHVRFSSAADPWTLHFNFQRFVDENGMEATRLMNVADNQSEIDAIYANVVAGNYGTDEGVVKPELLPTGDKATEILRIPNLDGSLGKLYERQNRRPWQEIL